MPEDLCSEVRNTVQKATNKTIPKQKKKQEDKAEYFSGLWLETLKSTSLIIIYTKESKAQRCWEFAQDWKRCEKQQQHTLCVPIYSNANTTTCGGLHDKLY